MPAFGDRDHAFILTGEEFAPAKPIRLSARAIITTEEKDIANVKEVLSLLQPQEISESLQWAFNGEDSASSMAALRLLCSYADMAALYE